MWTSWTEVEAMTKINGKQDKTAAGSTVAEYLKQKGYEVSRVAVERNGHIVAKSEYAHTCIEENDVLEIVGFVGGG